MSEDEPPNRVQHAQRPRERLIAVTTDQHDADVVVVGAGLAGLAAANAVVRANRSVVVLEAGDGIGGRVRTVMVEGFRLDRGFQVVLDAYPELHRQLDVDALQLKRFDPGALVWKGGRTYVVGDPLRRPKSIVATARAPIGTLADKARLAFARRRWMHEPVPSLLRQNDGSTRDELRRRGFSDNIVEAFFRPLLGGIQLDPQLAGSVRMADTVMAMLTRGSAAIPANGMGEIANQLGASLPAGSVRINACVGTVENTTAILVSGERVSGRALIVATEGPAAARLIGVRDPASKAVGCVYFDAPAAPIPQRL